ncbi:MAG: glycosyltransferase family 2 protein [archaeon]
MNKLSIIIPVYNEEKIIKKNSLRLQKYVENLGCEIIVCSNGSTDKTVSILRKIKGIKILAIKEKGTGIAFISAVKKASAPIILLIDIDLTTNMEFINQAIIKIKHYDIVSGSKIIGSQNRSIIRKLLGYLYYNWVRLLLYIPYTDYASAAKCYRKNAIEKFLPKLTHGTSYVTELLYYATRNKLSILEIPVKVTDKRKSKFNIVNESFRMFFGVLRIRFSKQ